MNIGTVVIAALPSALITAIFSFFLGRINKRLAEAEEKQQKREAARREFECYQIQMTAANAALGKANAVALQNGKCNGETHAALEYLETVKHKQRDFLYRHGVDDIF